MVVVGGRFWLIRLLAFIFCDQEEITIKRPNGEECQAFCLSAVAPFSVSVNQYL